MQLGICIIACQFAGEYRKTIESLKGLEMPHKIYAINSFLDLEHHFLTTKDEWTFVLYAREYLDPKLIEAMPTLLLSESIAAYKFFCVTKTITGHNILEAVRLYRRGAFLDKTALSAAEPHGEVVRILDGWIYEHGLDNKYLREVYGDKRDTEVS